MTTPPAGQLTPPPDPPRGTLMHIDRDNNLVVGSLWQKWMAPASQCIVETLDQTGRRVTVTRALTIGLFALGAKKKTGKVTVIVATVDGQTKTHSVPASYADKTLAWAVAFNLWREAVYGR